MEDRDEQVARPLRLPEGKFVEDCLLTVLKDILARLERLEQKMAPAQVQVPSVTSPYFTAEEAVAYLRLGTIKSLYGLVERGRLVPLRGSRRRIRFTKDMLDQFMQQEGRK
jgi:hypothetical protein